MNKLWSVVTFGIRKLDKFSLGTKLSYSTTKLLEQSQKHSHTTSVFYRAFSILTMRVDSSGSTLNGSGKLILSLNANPHSIVDQISSRRGMKIKARVKRRCKDCYLTWYKGLLYNYCKTHGRHKQMLKPKYWLNQRILTEVSQQPRRPW